MICQSIFLEVAIMAFIIKFNHKHIINFILNILNIFLIILNVFLIILIYNLITLKKGGIYMSVSRKKFLAILGLSFGILCAGNLVQAISSTPVKAAEQQGYAPDGQQQGYAPDGQQQGYAPDGQQQGYAPDGQQQGYAPDGQ